MWQPSFFPHVTAWAKSATSDIKFEFTVLHAFALIGICAVLYVAERLLDFVSFHFRTPSKPLQGYRRRGPKPTYALITGASAGIGFAVAKALVQNGFGVILLGHKADELAEAAATLREALVLPEDADPAQVSRDEYVRTIVMDAITATPEEMEATLRATIVDQALRVSVLVNNVGGVAIRPPVFRELGTLAPDEIDDTINLSARFMARLTALLMPVLAHRGAGVDQGMSFGTHRRSLVLNVSSQAKAGGPLLVMYSAVKAFNFGFSRALAREVQTNPETAHIDVLAVVPGDVRSQGNCVGLHSSACDAEYFGRCIVNKADGAVWRGWREFSPYWIHHLQDIAMGLASEKQVSKGMAEVVAMKKTAFDEYYKSKSE